MEEQLNLITDSNKDEKELIILGALLQLCKSARLKGTEKEEVLNLMNYRFRAWEDHKAVIASSLNKCISLFYKLKEENTLDREFGEKIKLPILK